MIGNKGFNQIDLAVALAIMLGLMTFVIIYTNSIVGPQITTVQSRELKYVSEGLADTIFADRGVPTDWPYQPEAIRPSLMEYIYVVPVSIDEYNNTGYTNVILSINLTVSERAYENSIKVYDGSVPLETNLTKKGDADADGLLTWMNVTFKVNVSAKQKKFVHVYFSEDNTTNAAYVPLTGTATTTFNVTTLDEVTLEGVTPLKLGRIHGQTAEYLKPRYGTRRSFRIEVENITGTAYTAGDALPTTTSVIVNERRVLSQNRSGHINNAKAILWIW